MKTIRWWYARIVFYPTLAWNLLLGRVLRVRNWWDEIEPHMILGARPLKSDVARLKSLGVSGIVNTCEEFPGHQSSYAEAGIEQLYIPTVDFTHPALGDVQKAVEFIEQQRLDGGRVYVHCKAGRARSATVAICHLIAHCGYTPQSAMAKLLEKRPHVNPRLLERPVVQQFINLLQEDPQGA